MALYLSLTASFGLAYFFVNVLNDFICRSLVFSKSTEVWSNLKNLLINTSALSRAKAVNLGSVKQAKQLFTNWTKPEVV